MTPDFQVHSGVNDNSNPDPNPTSNPNSQVHIAVNDHTVAFHAPNEDFHRHRTHLLLPRYKDRPNANHPL